MASTISDHPHPDGATAPGDGVPSRGSPRDVAAARRRALLDHAREVLFSTELDGTILDANTSAGAALGIELSIDRPETLLLCVGAPDAPAVRRVLETIARTSGAELDLHLRSPSGRGLWAVRARFGREAHAVLWSATTIVERTTSGLRRLVLDKTELLERERERATMAEAASAAKDRLLAIVGEDSAVTLNAVLGWTRMLRREVLDSASRDMALAVIEGNVERHLALVSELVDIARVIEGERQLEVGPVEVGELLDRVAAGAAERARERGVDLSRAPRLPSEDASRILGDRAMLETLLGAAIECAIDSAEQGDAVTVDARADDEMIVVRVSGGRRTLRGASLPRHALQAPGTGGAAHATAELALLVVERIARLHGGDASSELDGHGRRIVEARLPRLGAAPARSPFAAERPLRGLRVLLVEPDPDVRALATTRLRESGAHVLGARDAGTALGGIDAFRPDVVVADVASIGRGGELARALSSDRGPSPAVVALASAGDQADAERALDAPLVLPRPVDASALVEAIRRASDHRDR